MYVPYNVYHTACSLYLPMWPNTRLLRQRSQFYIPGPEKTSRTFAWRYAT